MNWKTMFQNPTFNFKFQLRFFLSSDIFEYLRIEHWSMSLISHLTLNLCFLIKLLVSMFNFCIQCYHCNTDINVTPKWNIWKQSYFYVLWIKLLQQCCRPITKLTDLYNSTSQKLTCKFLKLFLLSIQLQILAKSSNIFR